MEKFVDVLLPLPLPKSYTFHLAEDIDEAPQIGSRVIVQFGKKKVYSAIVTGVHNNKPEEYETKEILGVLDEAPIVSELHLTFWRWMAAYYMCTVGEVYKAAVPSGLKLESTTKLALTDSFEENCVDLSEKEEVIIKNLEPGKEALLSDIDKLLNVKSSLPIVKKLIDKDIIFISEKLNQKYKPKIEKLISLNEKYYEDSSLEELMNEIKRAPKQLQLLMKYIALTNHFSSNRLNSVKKNELEKEAGVSPAISKSLIDKGIFDVINQNVDRINFDSNNLETKKELTDFQEKALYDINIQFEKKDITLLHGITSSGKTEIYIHLIDKYIQQGRQVLYLLPEIALTTQIINRLTKVFGDKVGIFHSKFNDAERVEVWNDLRKSDGKFKLVLGVRSSVFLPFEDLGLIIVDEEHENSYKQYNPAPRYHARDSAIMLAKRHGAKVLLGSATPALESYQNAIEGRYGYAKIDRRFQDIKLPEIIVVNIRDAYKKNKMQSHFSPVLIDKMTAVMKEEEQIILFQNRRGFSPYLECTECGWIPNCKHCDVSLTYHKSNQSLTCHYCGFSQHIRSSCEACGSTSLRTKGFGTEKIEDEMSLLFPDAKVARMDLDTTRTRKSYQNIISDFENKKIDILIGTQMVTKGLDFDNVSIVGILNADNMLNYPDFRAFERSFQLMTQVSGRAGRKHKQGQVIIQTSNPSHAIIQYVKDNDFKTMASTQLQERKHFLYPPFFRLIDLTIKHKDVNKLNQAAEQIALLLRKSFANRVLGPEFPVINRIQNFYLKNILVKIEKEKATYAVKEHIEKIINHVKLHQDDTLLKVVIDVDPM
jgi:primosomal protein N' (replication factor Y)